MKDMTPIERAIWLNEFIEHWVNCYGCGPLGVCKAGINGFTFCDCKAVFAEMATDTVAFALYSETGEKVAEYHLNLETGMGVMVEDKTYFEDSYTDYRGMLADILSPIFNDDNDDAAFSLVNEPVKIDTTAPVVKPMSMEEIFKDIIKRIEEDNEEE
jgi:hypothetical protein